MKNQSQAKFKKLLEQEKLMQSQAGTDTYWTTQESLKSALADFVRMSPNMASLTTNQLLHVCRMVGSYRPVALHTFLIYCEKALENSAVSGT